MITFKCSQCEEQLEAPSSMIGERLQCPKCRFPEVIPDQEAQKVPSLTLEGSEDDNIGESLTQIRAFGDETGMKHKTDFNRPLEPGKTTATRIRTFHTRLSGERIIYMDDQINEWIDKNPDIEVKYTNAVIGGVEGKKVEPHLIVTVWY